MANGFAHQLRFQLGVLITTSVALGSCGKGIYSENDWDRSYIKKGTPKTTPQPTGTSAPDEDDDHWDEDGPNDPSDPGDPNDPNDPNDPEDPNNPGDPGNPPAPVLSPGVCGTLYDLRSVKPSRLPDWAQFTPMGRVVLNEFQVSKRSYKKRIPGVPESLTEWYGIRFRGVLEVPKSGEIQLSLRSDDGSRLTVDGAVVIDHDGVHEATVKTTKLNLNAGPHPIVIEYFQGPKHNVALWMAWKLPGSKLWVPIPASAFKGYGFDDSRCF